MPCPPSSGIIAKSLFQIFIQGENDDSLPRFGANIGVKTDHFQVRDLLNHAGQQFTPLLQ